MEKLIGIGISPTELEALIRRAVQEGIEAYMGSPREWVTVSEYSRRTGKSRNAIYTWIKKGLIRHRGGQGQYTEVLFEPPG